jgi:small G protein signaling modulator 3
MTTAHKACPPKLFSVTDREFQSVSYSPTPLHILDFLSKPAFTEAVLVRCGSDAFTAALTRLNEGVMEVDTNHQLERSSSHVSNRSVQSQRSQTVRAKSRKYASYTSSSASSIAASDKSLTSFPSFSPESPKHERTFSAALTDGTAQSVRRASGPAASLVDDLTAVAPSEAARHALFDDEPLSTRHVPGAIHHANDEHIERLIARNGAVALVRQIAQDLAQRDARIATLRRKTEERERALRKIILECGLSNMDLETRLRAIEEEVKPIDEAGTSNNHGSDDLEELINNAMTETTDFGGLQLPGGFEGGATIRASEVNRSTDNVQSKGATRGWKDYIWGSGTSKKSSRASSINGDSNGVITQPVTGNTSRASGRRTVLQNDIFHPPENTSVRSASRASSIQSGNTGQDRRVSLATLALKLVAGNANAGRDGEPSSTGRSRADSTGERFRGRPPAPITNNSSTSAKGVQVKHGPKSIPGRRTTAGANAGSNLTARTGPQDRWDTMGSSPQSTASSGTENYGPVEMDAILPLEAQPPTLTTVYHNHYNPEFLTDRFGFIYDQRRKKRQREAAETVQKVKRGSRSEMLSSARGGITSTAEVITTNGYLDARPDTPASIASADDAGGDSKPVKRWQDYLKIATFPTELLSHTPLRSDPGIEVLEADAPKSPGMTTEERGFVPAATTTAAPPVSVVSENAEISKPVIVSSTTALTKDDVEPVKLLLEQLSEVHDSLQREKTIKWNDFLRKVRAERKREGEAAAAAAETRSQRAMAVMPEATLTDGEIIGIAGLGNKGKVGRAKWNEFKSLVLGGIPVAYRAKVWAECSGATALRIPGYYDDLAAQSEEEDDTVIVAQIKMDINRTLTDNIFFRRGPGVAKLNEVLLAYSRRNAEVGYCQGMNLITACLLLIMPTAEDAFWILTALIENILPRGYYDHSLLASRADQQVLRQYVASILPKLSAHLDNLGIELEALTFQWFLSVFTDCLSAEALFRVWDVVLCTNDGSTFLFEVALALLKLNEQQLLECESPASIYTYINHQMTNHAISIDGLIHASEGLRKVVKREDIEARRAKAIEAEKALIRQREARNKLRKAERLAAANEIVPDAPEAEATVTPTKGLEHLQLELGADGYGELTVRTPMPAEEGREIGLG